jgi:hypothetical protein
MIARSYFCVGALQAVEPNHFKAFVFGIGQDRAGWRAALADDFDHIAFGNPQRSHGRFGESGNAVAAFFLAGRRDLQPHVLRFHTCRHFGHGDPSCCFETGS